MICNTRSVIIGDIKVLQHWKRICGQIFFLSHFVWLLWNQFKEESKIKNLGHSGPLPFVLHCLMYYIQSLLAVSFSFLFIIANSVSSPSIKNIHASCWLSIVTLRWIMGREECLLNHNQLFQKDICENYHLSFLSFSTW